MKIKDPKHPMTPGFSLMTCPSSTRRCIQTLTYLAQPVTSRKVWMTSTNRVATAGETADSSERRQPGQGGLAPRPAAPEREHPQQATKNPTEIYPQGYPRGGENEHPNRTELPVTTQANGQRITSAVCICGKVCKNLKGLKIHQAKMACLRRDQVKLRSGTAAGAVVTVMPAAEPGETEEEPGPESPHSTRNLQATQIPPPSRKSEHRRVKWPGANNKEWLKLDEDVDKCLESISKGSVDQKLQTMCTIIMNMGAERFGVEERRGDRNPAKLNRREAKISQLRQELKSLRRQFKMAKEEERTALSELTNIIRKRLISLRRAERHRRKGKERARKRSAFIGNPFSFIKKLLGQKRSGHLACPVEEIDNHLHATFSDTLRDHDLEPCRDLVAPPEPGIQFDSAEPTLKEVEEAVRAARSSFAPGPSGVTQ